MQMETNFAYIDENYKRIVDAMEEAKAKYRKPSDDITLMAVTKTVAPEAVNHAISSGERTTCSEDFRFSSGSRGSTADASSNWDCPLPR